jgi:hypothetical protein
MECFGTSDFDNNSRLIILPAIIISGLHCTTNWSQWKLHCIAITCLTPSKQRSRIHALIGQHLRYVLSESFLRWIKQPCSLGRDGGDVKLLRDRRSLMSFFPVGWYEPMWRGFMLTGGRPVGICLSLSTCFALTLFIARKRVTRHFWSGTSG